MDDCGLGPILDCGRPALDSALVAALDSGRPALDPGRCRLDRGLVRPILPAIIILAAYLTLSFYYIT